MSWSEVVKINNDLSIPINMANLINHINMVGSNYVGENDIETTAELLRYDILNSNNIALEVAGRGFWEYISTSSVGVGGLINKAFKLNDATLSSYQTLTSFLANVSDATLFKLGKNFTFLNSFRAHEYASSIFASMVTPPLVAGMFSDSEIINLMHSELYNINTLLPVKQIRENSTTFAYMNGSTFLAKLTTTGAGTYTVPANVYSITAMCISGGGGGGGSLSVDPWSPGIGGSGGGSGGSGGGGVEYANGSSVAGGGAGAGSYKVYSIAVTPAQEIGYYVGAGGAGGLYTSTPGLQNGSNGETSYFGSIGQTLGYKYVSSQDYTFPTLSTGGARPYGSGEASNERAGSGGGNGTSAADTNFTGTNLTAGGGGGGFAGGNGTSPSGLTGPAFDGQPYYGTGGATFGTGGGGLCGQPDTSTTSGPGGGGYGGGGGGCKNVSATGGNGGQGIIALYLGYNQFTE